MGVALGQGSSQKMLGFFDIPAVAAASFRSFSKILKGNSQILGFPSPEPRPFFSRWDFMICLGKLKLCTTFEVASLSHCRNIKGEPPNFGDIKFCAQFGFVKTHRKVTLTDKCGHGRGLGSLPKIWRFLFLIFLQSQKLSTSNLVYCLSLPVRPVITSHQMIKVVGSGLEDLHKIWCSF